MATHLDLEEQEQLDALKHFWKRYGNLITWALIAALGVFAAYNGWNWYERDKSAKAALLFDEIDRAVQAGDIDRASRAFGDMKERYGSTTFAVQGGLLLARLQFDKGQIDPAKASLEWVAQQSGEPAYPVVAKLRLAGVLLDEKKYDEALKALPAEAPKGFAALAADRRGDILAAQGKTAEAVTAYRSAYEQMEPTLDYRRLIDAKLTALGASPSKAASTPAVAAASAPAAGASQ